MIWQELEQLLARDVEVFIDGRWQQGILMGFGPGYSSDDVEITVMTATRSTRENTFICKQDKLSSRLRCVADTEVNK